MPEFDSTIEYRDAVGFPGYKVGNDGSVWSCRLRYKKTPRGEWYRIKDRPRKNNYLYVELYLGLRRLRRKENVHRLVLITFSGLSPEGMQAAHENGNRRDNRLANLSWKTPASNCADRERHGNTARGISHGMSKLTDAKVVEIRRLHTEESISVKKLSMQFGVSMPVIAGILCRKGWKHVP